MGLHWLLRNLCSPQVTSEATEPTNSTPSSPTAPGLGARGQQEVLAWLSGQSSNALVDVINKHSRASVRRAPKLAPPTRGSEEAHGWLASRSQMALQEVVQAHDKASIDSQRGDSTDLQCLYTPKGSLSLGFPDSPRRTSVSSEVQKYLNGISVAASAVTHYVADGNVHDESGPMLPQSPFQKTSFVDEALGTSAPEPVSESKKLVIPTQEASKSLNSGQAEPSEPSWPAEWEKRPEDMTPEESREFLGALRRSNASLDLASGADSSNESDDTTDDDEEEEEGEEDDILWTANANSSQSSMLLPLASGTVRRATEIEVSPGQFPGHVGDIAHVLPLRVAQPMKAQAIDVVDGTVSLQPDVSSTTDGAKDDVDTNSHACSKVEDPGLRAPTSSSEDSLARQPVCHAIINNEAVSSIPTDDAFEGWYDEKNAENNLPRRHGQEFPVHTRRDAMYDIDSGRLHDCIDSSPDSISKEDDPGRTPYSTFSESSENSSCSNSSVFPLDHPEAAPHLDVLRRHFSLPAHTSADEIQMCLSRNIEAIRATLLSKVCNPRFLYSTGLEISTSPDAAFYVLPVIDALYSLEWHKEEERGGLVPACLRSCQEALQSGQYGMVQALKKCAPAHLVETEAMTWSQITRLLRFIDYETLANIKDQHALVRSGRTEEFIDLVRKGILSNENRMFETPGALIEAMGLETPPTAEDRRLARHRDGGFQGKTSPLRQVTTASP